MVYLCFSHWPQLWINEIKCGEMQRRDWCRTHHIVTWADLPMAPHFSSFPHRKAPWLLWSAFLSSPNSSSRTLGERIFIYRPPVLLPIPVLRQRCSGTWEVVLLWQGSACVCKCLSTPTASSVTWKWEQWLTNFLLGEKSKLLLVIFIIP